MNSPVQYAVIAAFAYLVAIRWAYRMLRYRRHDRALWIFACCLFAGATAFVLRIPALYTAVDRAAGIPNLSELFIFVAFLCCAFLVMLWTLLWAEPAATRRRPGSRSLLARLDLAPHTPPWIFAGFGALVAALAALFLTGRQGVERPVDFETYYVRTPHDAALILLFLTAFTAAWPVAALRCREARRALEQLDERWAAYGMRLVAGGMWLAALYALAQAAIPLEALAGADVAEQATLAVGNAFATLSPVHSIAGVTCGSWGPWLDRRRLARRTQLERDALDRLWQTLAPYTVLAPIYRRLEATLAAAGADSGPGVPNAVWQIVDGYRNVSPYLDADVAARVRRRAVARGYRGARLDAVVEAATLAAALRSADRGTPAQRRHSIPSFPDDGRLAAQWQIRVARALPLLDADGQPTTRPVRRGVQLLGRVVASAAVMALGSAMFGAPSAPREELVRPGAR